MAPTIDAPEHTTPFTEVTDTTLLDQAVEEVVCSGASMVGAMLFGGLLRGWCCLFYRRGKGKG